MDRSNGDSAPHRAATSRRLSRESIATRSRLPLAIAGQKARSGIYSLEGEGLPGLSPRLLQPARTRLTSSRRGGAFGPPESSRKPAAMIDTSGSAWTSMTSSGTKVGHPGSRMSGRIREDGSSASPRARSARFGRSRSNERDLDRPIRNYLVDDRCDRCGGESASRNAESADLSPGESQAAL